jgi:hypothetical protein
MERKTERRLVCGRRKCRNALAVRCGLGRYLPSSDAISSAKKSVNKGPERPIDDERAWRIIAGPELTADQLRAATVPDGPNGRWARAAYQVSTPARPTDQPSIDQSKAAVQAWLDALSEEDRG